MIDQEETDRSKHLHGGADEDWEVPEGVHRFTMAELSKATGHFNRDHEIGSGGFGKVFFGTLPDGKVVAIKRASTTSMQGQVEFRNEVNLLSRLHHRHLVRLEGFCEDQDLQILVYEFMKNGNLSEHIYRMAPNPCVVCLHALYCNLL